ncbi:Hsp20/alpha crystallin [Mactra antiquata]
MGRFYHPVQVLTMPRQQHMEELMRCRQPSLEKMLADVFLLPQLRHSRNRTVSSDCPPCCMRMCRSTPSITKKPWIQVVDMEGFRPRDINVKTEGSTLIVHARREDVQGENIDIIDRKRVISIPDGVDKKKIICRCNLAGHFVIMGTYTLEGRKPEESSKPIAQSKDVDNTVEEKTRSATAEQNIAQNEEKSETIDEGNKSNECGDVNQCNDAYIVNEATDVSDDDCDKQPEVSTAETNADLLLEGESVADFLCGRESPIPSEEFVILDNKTDEAQITDLAVEHDGETAEDKISHTETDSFVSKDVDGNKSFNIKLSLKDFPADNINVRCKDSSLFVDAKHEWKNGDMFRSQELHRMYQLPEDAMKTDARACMDADGMFTITVPIRHDQDEEKVDIAIEQE